MKITLDCGCLLDVNLNCSYKESYYGEYWTLTWCPGHNPAITTQSRIDTLQNMINAKDLLIDQQRHEIRQSEARVAEVGKRNRRQMKTIEGLRKELDARSSYPTLLRQANKDLSEALRVSRVRLLNLQSANDRQARTIDVLRVKLEGVEAALDRKRDEIEIAFT